VPLNWLKPVEFVADGRPQKGRVVWDDGETVTVETDEIIDWDDDGLDENGAPIMRPLYRRYYVARDLITTCEEK
jgi:hypothetical protein